MESVLPCRALQPCRRLMAGRNRLSTFELLTDPLRRRILQHVRRHPGATAGGIADALGCSRGRADHHLGLLYRRSLVARTVEGRVQRYFLPGRVPTPVPLVPPPRASPPPAAPAAG